MYLPKSAQELSEILESLELYSRLEGLSDVSEALGDARVYLARAGTAGPGDPDSRQDIRDAPRG